MKKASINTSKVQIHVLLITLGIFLSAILAACSTQQTEFTTGEFATTRILTNFMPDGKYTVYDRALDSFDVTDGHYTIDGNKLTLVDGNDQGCGADVGQYTWDFDGERLSFELIEDACENRTEALSLRYVLQK